MAMKPKQPLYYLYNKIKPIRLPLGELRANRLNTEIDPK